MATNGPSLRAWGGDQGNGVAYSQPTSPQTFSLDPGAYQVILSQIDVNNPTTITLTDSLGGWVSFTTHGVFPYAIASLAMNPISLSFSGGAGADFISIKQHNGGNLKSFG